MQSIPVNPDMLKWARNTAGLSIADVVKQVKRKRITQETVLNWEKGNGSPSYSQLELLAYKIYKRPLALFFFPEPPEEESPQQAFRTLPEYEIERMPPRMRLLIRKARALQINLSELYDNINPASKQILLDLSFEPSVSPEYMALKIREYLGVELNVQIEWSDVDEAMKEWRAILEKHGIITGKIEINPGQLKKMKLGNNLKSKIS